MATNTGIAARYMNGMDQASTRGIGLWFDQHKSSTYLNAKGERLFENGRPYYSIIELKTRMPVGPVMPLGWEAPFYAPQQYLLTSIGRVTNVAASIAEGIPLNVNSDRFRIDYNAMKRDDTEATMNHWRLAVAEAASRDWDVPEFGAPMDRRLLAIVGPAPRSPKIADALLSGDPWILGQLMPTADPKTGALRVEENEALARLLRLNRQDVYSVEAWSEQAKAPSDELSEAKAILAETLKAKAEIAAMLKEVKGSAPKSKKKSEPEAA
jgi:hypothetical protein